MDEGMNGDWPTHLRGLITEDDLFPFMVEQSEAMIQKP
jgi:hypothetical protein